MEDKFLLIKTSTGKEYKLKKLSFFDKEKALNVIYKIVKDNDKDDVIWFSAIELFKDEKKKGIIDFNIVKYYKLDPNTILENEFSDNAEFYADMRLEDLYHEQIRENSQNYYKEITNEVLYDWQEKDITDNLKSLDYWHKNGRKPKDEEYIIYMSDSIEDYIANNFYKEYCFVEDTIPIDEREMEFFKIKDELKTAWQWLSENKRKVKNKAIPVSKRNWILNDFTQEFYQEDKAFYYYKGADTEKITEEEYNKLKELYINLYGGWERIDLENTEYNGKKWY
ncbi:MAG: hypothetical protein E6696_00370 [Anaerococcus hydrogenalis]|nr:hypothetical protein [Anaerococcus hydrogenalis]